MGREDLAEESAELGSLEGWLEDIRHRRPLSRREELEQALADALRAENYEKAAQVRDALEKLPKSKK
jgi:protein-arginine kinase activator protein McsA